MNAYKTSPSVPHTVFSYTVPVTLTYVFYIPGSLTAFFNCLAWNVWPPDVYIPSLSSFLCPKVTLLERPSWAISFTMANLATSSTIPSPQILLPYTRTLINFSP